MKDGGSAGGAPPARPSFTLFALAEVRGQIGPCGCTTDPLGDISRTTKLVEEARTRGPVLVVDAGSLLFSQNPVPPVLEAEEQLKADLLARVYQKDLQVAAIGLGPADLAKGPAAVKPPRLTANLSDPALPTEPVRMDRVGDVQVGTFAVIAEGAVAGLHVQDPIAAGKRAVADLRGKGAQVVVGLVQASSKKDAVALVRAIGGVDFAIAGLGLAAPEPDRVEIEPSKVDGGWLIVPANRGQVVSRLDIFVRGGAPFADAGGAGAAAARLAQIDKELAERDAELARFAKDPSADPKFVAQKRDERARLVAERERLKSQPLTPPAHGSYFTLDQVRINKALACSVPVQDLVKAYDVAAGEANVKAAAGKPVPQPPKGQPTYVGMEACADCHSDAVEFWKKTVHAQAWQTLVERGQQFRFECIGCHVTGWDRPGGSNLAHNDKLRDVQCETCHGPGSIHVAKGGEEKPAALRRDPPPDLCASQCHTHEHSDTFEREAYLRDIVGPGHGAALRTKLGDGPTGHELRKAALDKAGRTLGAGCTR